MCCFYNTSNAINLVTASVDASISIVEHTVLIPDVVNGSAPTHRVIFAKYVAQITKQQGRYAVGHGLSPLVIRSRSRDRTRCLDARIQGKLQQDASVLIVQIIDYRNQAIALRTTVVSAMAICRQLREGFAAGLSKWRMNTYGFTGR
jgi:hypothetical protein